MSARYSWILRLLSMRSGKPPMMFCLAASSSCSVGPLLDEVAQRLAHHRQRLVGLVALASAGRSENGPALLQRREVAVGAVGESALLAHLLGEARHEAAAAEHVVADEQREIIRIVAPDARRADQDVALRRRMRDHRACTAASQRLHRRQCRRGAAGCAAGRGQLLGDRLGLLRA